MYKSIFSYLKKNTFQTYEVIPRNKQQEVIKWNENNAGQ